jgi:hypothetical protein
VVLSSLPVRASALTAATRVRDGIVAGHGGSTTFPWVPSRPVQLGYDRALRGAWVSCYHWWCHVWSSCWEFVMPAKDSGYGKKRRSERRGYSAKVQRVAENEMRRSTRWTVTDRSPSTGAPNRRPRSVSDGRGGGNYLVGGGRWQGSSRTLPEPKGVPKKRKQSARKPQRSTMPNPRGVPQRRLPKTR